MQKVRVGVKKLDNFSGDLPQYESIAASGFDLRAQVTETICLEPGQRTLVPTGLAFEIPIGYEIQIRPRSGLAVRQGLSMVNTPGTIDADYRGEVKVIVINHGQEAIKIENHERIAQAVLCPIFQAEFEEKSELSDTSRGAGGFGSTGV
jgi:dUTP pyrophosphatase